MKLGIVAFASILIVAAAAAATMGWSPTATPPAPTGKLGGSTIG